MCSVASKPKYQKIKNLMKKAIGIPKERYRAPV